MWIEESSLHEPLDLASAMAHELCHVHLLGHGRLTAEEDDHQPLTDLLTVFLGIGIITSNSALNELYWQSGVLSGWRMSRRGYLTMPTYGYALPLSSMLRDETSPDSQKYLRPDTRHAFKQSLAYLGQHGMPHLRSVLTTIARPTRLQSDATDEVPELASDTAVCTFCGVKLPTAEHAMNAAIQSKKTNATWKLSDCVKRSPHRAAIECSIGGVLPLLRWSSLICYWNSSV